MSKKFQDSVSFGVMTILIFIVITLSNTFLSGSSGAGIRYLDLHWIVLREDLAQVLTIFHFYSGKLAAMITISLCLTWILSRALKVLRQKKIRVAWLLFIFVILFLLGIACDQGYIFT